MSKQNPAVNYPAVPLKFVDFVNGVSGAGMYITSYRVGNTPSVSMAYWTPLGIVLVNKKTGDQLLVMLTEVKSIESLHPIDWTLGDHELDVKEQSNLAKVAELKGQKK